MKNKKNKIIEDDEDHYNFQINNSNIKEIKNPSNNKERITINKKEINKKANKLEKIKRQLERYEVKSYFVKMDNQINYYNESENIELKVSNNPKNINNLSFLNKKFKREENINTNINSKIKIFKPKIGKINKNYNEYDIEENNEKDVSNENDEKEEILKMDEIENTENDDISEKEVKEVLIENEENYDIYNYAENIDIDYIPSVSEFSRKIKSLSQSSTTSFSSYKNKKRNLTKNKSNINLTKKRVIKTSSKKIKNNQSNLVNELLCRWWYALPQWPPEDYDISDKLREKKLRLINIKGWKKEPKNDEKGYEKCIQLPGFKYVVSDSNGKIYDFRPQKGKPSYSNFIKMPKKQLCRLLLEALKKQLEELNNRKIVSEQELRKTIKNKLEQVQRIFNDL